MYYGLNVFLTSSAFFLVDLCYSIGKKMREEKKKEQLMGLSMSVSKSC